MLSIVVPVFNEADSLGLLYEELAAVARDERYDAEFIFVDDGSTDESWRVIARLAESDPRVRGIRFRRNFGKAAALSAAFQSVRGEIVITLDADLQDDPREIPRFLAALDGLPAVGHRLDVISGWKRVRHDPWHKVGPSRVFNRMVSTITGVHLHDHNCGMKCYRREALAEVRLYGEMHRFVPVLAAARGFRVGEIEIRHRPRRFGHSKYGVRRFAKGFLDLLTVKFLTSFSHRPQHVLGTMGLLFIALGGLALVYLALYWLGCELRGVDPKLHQRPAVVYSVGLLLLGGQLFSIGFIAELITAFHGRESDTYSIAERAPGPEPLASHPTSDLVTDPTLPAGQV